MVHRASRRSGRIHRDISGLGFRIWSSCLTGSLSGWKILARICAIV